MTISYKEILFLIYLLIGFSSCQENTNFTKRVKDVLRDQELAQAEQSLLEEPITVTAHQSKLSEGSKHDFFSQGDYWWPDPENPEGSYIQRDGMTNPNNFVEHRKSMIRLSQIIGSLASAYVLTNNSKYVDHAFKHMKAWFVDTATMMNPSLLYSQAIVGKVSGRGIGIIDTIHLMEVALGILAMENAAGLDQQLVADIKNWFAQYLAWLMTHPYSLSERDHGNNHSTCWVMQVASFAKLTSNEAVMNECRDRYKEVLLPIQMATDGSFPKELNRTKPYGYSLFNLDAMTMVCHILSTTEENLWEYQTEDGKSIRKGLEFMYPYVVSKEDWPKEPDVMYWDNWPVAHPFLVMGANAFNNENWFETWKKLDHSPKVREVIRNLPVRNPIIWLE